MDALPPAEIARLLPILTQGVIETIADRPNESPRRREERAQEAMRQIEAYDPRTALEIMLAGNAVLFQNLALEAARAANQVTLEDDARRLRQQATSLGRLQLSFVREMKRGNAAAGKGREATVAAPAAVAKVVEEVVVPPARAVAPPAVGVVTPPTVGVVAQPTVGAVARPPAPGPITPQTTPRDIGRRPDLPPAVSRAPVGAVPQVAANSPRVPALTGT